MINPNIFLCIVFFIIFLSHLCSPASLVTFWLLSLINETLLANQLQKWSEKYLNEADEAEVLALRTSVFTHA